MHAVWNVFGEEVNVVLDVMRLHAAASADEQDVTASALIEAA